MKVQDVIDYVRKENKIFKGWTDEEIADTVVFSISCGTFFYSTDSEGKINGVVVAGFKDNMVHVYGINTSEKGVFQKFVKLFNSWFKNCTLSAYRDGQYREYRYLKEMENYGR